MPAHEEIYFVEGVPFKRVSDERTLDEAKAERKTFLSGCCHTEILKAAPIEKQLSALNGDYSTEENQRIKQAVTQTKQKYEALKATLVTLGTIEEVENLTWEDERGGN